MRKGRPFGIVRKDLNMIHNVIFDIGNVLTDFRWKEFLMDQGYSEEMAMRIGRASTLHPCWAELDRGYWTVEQLMEAFVRNDPGIERELRSAYANVRGMVVPRAYAIPWVRELKRKGYRVYYLSNFSAKAETECAEALEFLPYTDGGILSYKEKMIKPDPAIYKLLLSRYGLKAEECVFLDDTPANVEAAKALGMQGIRFLDKEQAEAELQKMGVE